MSGSTSKIVTGIKLTEETRQRLQQLQQMSSLSAADRQTIEADLQRGLLSSKSMKLMMSQDKSNKPVFSATKDLSVVMSREEKAVTEAESAADKQQKEARREYLKIKQEERVYNQMIYGKDSNPHLEQEASMGAQVSSFKYQMSIAFNMVFSVGATFGMTYYITIHLNFNHNQAMMFGLVCAIIIMVIEMILFIMRSIQIEENIEKPMTTKKSNLVKFRSGALAPDPNFKPDLPYQPPENEEVDRILRGEGPDDEQVTIEEVVPSLQQKKDQ